MLPLFIPWILILLLLADSFFLLKKKWLIAAVIFIMVFVLNWWSECIPLRLCGVSRSEKETLSLISFNIDGSAGDPLKKAKVITSFLHRNQSDIAFVAEFNEQFPGSLDSLLNIEYEYTTYPDSLFFQYFFGHQFFFDSRRLKDINGDHVGVYACKTVFQGDTIDLYGCHFASNNYGENLERVAIDEIADKEGLFSYVKNIHIASDRRTIEANTIVRELSKSHHQAIVMGDMNDVGGSAAIRILEKAGLKDVWWEGGVGYGATILSPMPYRIDHIMYTSGLRLEIIRVLDGNGISDHNALYAEFSFNN